MDFLKDSLSNLKNKIFCGRKQRRDIEKSCTEENYQYMLKKKKTDLIKQKSNAYISKYENKIYNAPIKYSKFNKERRTNSLNKSKSTNIILCGKKELENSLNLNILSYDELCDYKKNKQNEDNLGVNLKLEDYNNLTQYEILNFEE
jgi:hypothetical protein